LETEAIYHVLIVGAIRDHIMTTSSVLEAPARKLLRWHCREGRYKKPPPDECGGTMKMS
jgi:hypothetical protein